MRHSPAARCPDTRSQHFRWRDVFVSKGDKRLPARALQQRDDPLALAALYGVDLRALLRRNPVREAERDYCGLATSGALVVEPAPQKLRFAGFEGIAIGVVASCDVPNVTSKSSPASSKP